MNDKSFRIFGEMVMEKCRAAGRGGAAADVLITGRMLNEVKDFEGETPIVPEMDWSYFDKSGYVKYEHDPIETVVTPDGKLHTRKSIPDPENIIGVPVRRWRKGGKEEFVTAALFPGMAKAQSVIRLMDEIQAHNERHPEAKRTLGFSVEGGYIKKSNGRYAGRVINVVVTPIPQDSTTYAERAAVAHKSLAKSMSAGYGLEPATQDDGGALRLESLQGNKNNVSHGGHKMEKHKSAEECYKHHLSKGLSPEEAKKKAEEWAAAEAAEKKEKGEGIEKSVAASIAVLNDASTVASELVKMLDGRTEAITALSVEMNKSIAALGKQEEVDGAAFLANQSQAVIELSTFTREGLSMLAKSQGAFVQGMAGILDVVNSIRTATQEIAEKVEGLNTVQTRIVTGLKKSAAADAVANRTEGTLIEGVAEMAKSIPVIAAQDFLVNRGIAERSVNPDKAAEYFGAQRVVATQGFGGLSKSMRDEMQAHFAKK